MRLLLERSRFEKLRHRQGLKVVQEYPAFLLVEVKKPPAELAQGEYEALDDPVISVNGRPVTIPEGEYALGEEPHTLVRFIGPVAAEWRAALQAGGVEALFWAPRFGACLRLPPGMDGAALRAAFPFIAGAQPYRQEQAQRGISAHAEALRRQTGLPGDLYDLICFSRAGRPQVEEALRGLGIEIVDAASSKVRVRYRGDLAVLRDIIGVKVVDPARGPVLSAPAPAGKTSAYTTDNLLEALDFPRAPANAPANSPGDSAPPPAAWNGEGQIIAVADTGLDNGQNDERLHPDLRGQVIFLRSWPINPSWNGYLRDPNAFDDAADRDSGHGTHVAGLALGSGAASRGVIRGVAPAARLVFQAIEQYVNVKAGYQRQVRSGYYLAGRPLNLRELFEESYAQGARVMVNAWGDPANGQYTNDSYEVDLFLSEHPDVVMLCAAGNDGVDRNGDRIGDPVTLYSPASAKNCVTVGATEGPRPNCGKPATWGSIDPRRQRFTNPYDRAEDLAGQPQRMALFSSRGPTRDRRIKPDVCAPGSKLAAPRSSLLPFSKPGWGLANPLPRYMYNVGTSMSTGVAGGFMAALRQAWQTRLGGSAPSGAALKALAVAGARAVLRRANTTAAEEESRGFCGFGRLALSSALPADTLQLFDCAPGLLTGQVDEYQVEIAQAGLFRAALAWYDAPGEALVNDLDLLLEGPDGARAWGNQPAGVAGLPDRVNTVEVIQADGLAPGAYRLTVRAINVMTGAQPYALAARLPEGTKIVR